MGSSHPNLGPRLVGVRASRRTKNSEGPQGREPGSVELAPYTHTRHAPAHTHAVTHPPTHTPIHTRARAEGGQVEKKEKTASSNGKPPLGGVHPAD